MRIVFAGTPANAAKTLLSLLDSGFLVVGVLTREDAAVGRKKIITPSPVAQVATEAGIALWKSNSLDVTALKWLKELEPDLGVIVAYGSILKKQALAIPAKGWLNLHYSLLPDLPGAAPVQWAILQGRQETGVTVFELDEGIDTGPIYAQQPVAIAEDFTSGQLLDVLTDHGVNLLSKTIREIANGTAVKTKQPLRERTESASKLTRASAKINFSDTCAEVLNLVRAMNPEPMAWCEFGEDSIRVLSAAPSEEKDLAIGQVKSLDQRILVGCKGGSVQLLIVQPAGKLPMLATEWFRGLHLEQVQLS